MYVSHAPATTDLHTTCPPTYNVSRPPVSRVCQLHLGRSDLSKLRPHHISCQCPKSPCSRPSSLAIPSSSPVLRRLHHVRLPAAPSAGVQPPLQATWPTCRGPTDANVQQSSHMTCPRPCPHVPSALIPASCPVTRRTCPVRNTSSSPGHLAHDTFMRIHRSFSFLCASQTLFPRLCLSLGHMLISRFFCVSQSSKKKKKKKKEKESFGSSY